MMHFRVQLPLLPVLLLVTNCQSESLEALANVRKSKRSINTEETSWSRDIAGGDAFNYQDTADVPVNTWRRHDTWGV